MYDKSGFQGHSCRTVVVMEGQGRLDERRPRGLAVALAQTSFGVVRPADARGVYAFPTREFRRLEAAGAVHRVATGYYAVVPQAVRGSGWLPSLEAVAYGIAAADYGPGAAVLMGISAARLHGAVPRGLGVAVVAVPKQRPPVALRDRPAQVVFVKRDVARLEAEPAAGDLGAVLVTTIEQMVLDLAHRPGLGGVPDEARAAVRDSWGRIDIEELRRLAGEQRLSAAARRAESWAAGKGDG
jgi:predicted transcriptional regulator of viral defense system